MRPPPVVPRQPYCLRLLTNPDADRGRHIGTDHRAWGPGRDDGSTRAARPRPGQSGSSSTREDALAPTWLRLPQRRPKKAARAAGNLRRPRSARAVEFTATQRQRALRDFSARLAAGKFAIWLQQRTQIWICQRTSTLVRPTDSSRTLLHVRKVPKHKVAALQPAAREQELRGR
jgi:hypothetical protein